MQSQESIEDGGILGHYVSEDYFKRAEGFDWVSVAVSEAENNQINISVRSRADKKKPTCTFDTKAFKRDENTYETMYDGKRIIFRFTDKNITVATAAQEDSDVLYFFCSGGASLAGTYMKIDEALDTEQIDLAAFSKVLHLQGIGFNVSSIEQDDQTVLSVKTFGLEKRDYDESFNIEGQKVIDAEVEDLNSDGSPDLFVYTKSPGSDKRGHVYAFSVNNMQSMSMVYFQPTAENQKINKGYAGHDEFAVVENTLSQRFPLYEAGDSNSSKTGVIRQVSYKLTEGEAMRKLEVHQITEY